MDDYLSKPINDVELFSKLNGIASGQLGRAAGTAPRTAYCGPLLAIDPARLDMIADVMHGQALSEFLDVFLISTAERIARVGNLAGNDELEEIGRVAHTLLGTAGNFGAMQLS